MNIGGTHDEKKDKSSGFGFMAKTGVSNNSNTPKQDLVGVFENTGTTQQATTPHVDLTKCKGILTLAYTVGIDDIFNNKPEINVGHITSAYQQNYEVNGPGIKTENLDKLLQNNFNYDKVYNTIDATKGVKKDPFSFVDDMLKKK
jgi:hypothetical protein